MSATTWRSMLTMPVSPARDHIRGPIDAPVTLLEYGDYECPFCGAAHAVVNTILAQVGDAVRFVFRHFPMTTVHPHAELAAEAAEAAASQQRFWDMHDMLYANQQQLDGPSLLATRPPLLSISTATARKSPGICICRRSVRTS
jgi:Na+:H+ antiporter, NhaA family